MSETVIRVIDGRHVVGLSETGIDWRPLASFATPREAIDSTTSAGNPVPAPDTVARYVAAVRADAGRGGLIPPGSPRPAPALRAAKAVPIPSGGVDSQQPAPLGTRADLPGADPGTHPPGV